MNYVWLLIGLVVLMVLSWLFFGWQKTASILRRFGKIRDFQVISDITVSDGEKSAHIDDILIGYFGILLVTTCSQRGDYYGTLQDENWVISPPEGRGGSRKAIPNPLRQQQQATQVIRSILAQNKQYKVMIDSVVYMSDKKITVFVKNDEKIIPFGKLSAYLKKTKFESDAGIDVAKLAALLTASQADQEKA